MAPKPDIGRFWAKVEKTDGCWLWKAARDLNGYGRIAYAGKEWKAHRLAYTVVVGPIPEGLTLDHLCRVRHCVNPAHLEPVTNRENLLRGNGWAGRHARKTHCPQNHPYDEANTYRMGANGRGCRTCAREAMRRKRATRVQG